ncbi:MAG: hypothetical protein AAB504_01860 [Patescibacteria group bacterium]
MEILEGKFKKEDDEKIYHYRCKDCDSKFEEEEMSHCLNPECKSRDIEKIVEEKEENEIEGEVGGKGEEGDKVEESKFKSKQEELVEFTKSILGKGGYVEGEKIPKISETTKKEAPLEKEVSIKKEVIEKKTDEALRLAIRGARVHIGEIFFHYPEDMKRIESEIKDFLDERLRVLNDELRIRRGAIALDEQEERRQFLDEVCDLQFKSRKYSFSPQKIESLKKILWGIKDNLFTEHKLNLSQSEKIKKTSEYISKRLADYVEFEDFFQRQKSEGTFKQREALKKIDMVIEDEIGKSWQRPLPMYRFEVLTRINIPEYPITANLLREKLELEKLKVSGFG